MGIHRGPNTVKDGLVFGYDTGYGVADNSTATRFYPGEPATNNSILAAYTWNGDGGNQSFANKGATAITDNSLKYNGYDTVLWTPGGSQNCYLNGTGDFNYSDSSTVWTFSCYVKREDGVAITSLNVYMYYPSSDGTAAGTIVDCGNGWYRVSRTRTGSSNAIQLAGFTGFSAGNKYYLSGVMLSKTSHTVPYVAVQSSRSSTASLIDLKKTTNIDVSNVSFDSTGQPTFDETDDHITGTLPMNGLGAPHTIEMVFSCNVNQGSIGSRKDPFTIGNSSIHQYSALDVNTSSMNWYFYGRDTTFTNSPLMVANKFYHMVLSYAGGASNNTNKKVWLNGVQQTLSAGSSETPLLPNNPSFSVGRDRGRNTAYWPGEIPVWKVYQKALSAAEAQQNYNAYKNRFGL